MIAFIPHSCLVKQVDVIFPTLRVRKLRWLANVTLWTSGESRTWTQILWPQVQCHFTHMLTIHTLWQWKAMAYGMKAGMQGWKGVGGICPARTSDLNSCHCDSYLLAATAVIAASNAGLLIFPPNAPPARLMWQAILLLGTFSAVATNSCKR